MKNFGQLISPLRKAPRDPADNSKWGRFRRNIFVSFVIDLVVIVGTALVLSLLIKSFLVRSFFVPSGSMLETLQIDDRIIVNELVPDLIAVERGDVVVFKDPGGWLGPVSTPSDNPVVIVSDWFLSAFGITAPDSSQHLVKRVIGVGGDHIVCCDADGRLTINGKAITEPYLPKDVKPSTIDFDVVVPEGSIWVMGDNRDNSADSRFHLDLPSKGFVSKEFIVGRAFLITWPFSHFGWLDNHPNVFADVPNP
jgi:signal peptidase I